MYIGQTGRSLKQRVTEHKRALSSLDCNTSAIAEHAIKNHHEINWKNAKIVDREQDY